MKKMVILALVALVVSGCSTITYMNRALGTVQGKNINVLIDIMGLPNAEQVIAGRRAFIWNNESTVNTVTPVFSTTQGSVIANSTSLNNRSYGTYNQSTTAYVPTTRRSSCTITVEVDDAGTILKSHTHGTRRGCNRYVRDFKNRHYR